MKHGFFAVAAGTPGIRLADCGYNQKELRRLYLAACDSGAGLLVLPELCLTGYTCGDLFLQDTLLDAAQTALLRLVEQSAGEDMLCAVGAPLRRGNKLYNCGVLFQNGRILGVIPKTHLHNYAEFNEARHFAPAPKDNGSIRIGGMGYPFGAKLLFQCETLPELCIGVEVCEDLWSPSPPSTGLALHGATVIANLSASGETTGKAGYRRLLVMSQSARLACGYVYADAGRGESTGDMVFAGHNMIAENGTLLCENQPFTGELCVSEMDVQRLMYERRRISTFPSEDHDGYVMVPFRLPVRETKLTRSIPSRPFIPAHAAEREAHCEEILNILAHGLMQRLTHTHCDTLVIGVSGGLDSTLALLVCARTMDLLGRDRAGVTAVTMPCFGTTSRTRGNAERLLECLHIPCRTVDITAAVRQHLLDIGHGEDTYDVTYENAQARERTQVLMDIANQKNGLVVGTGDLSELALGWATYNGDHMSMYGVNGSIPKTLIRHMVHHVAQQSQEELRGVLMDILDTPVSPELLPADGGGEISQKTEQLVGPYDLHDFFLYWMIRWGAKPDKVLRLTMYAFQGEYDEATIRYWLKTFCRRFFQQQFKRSCLPDGPKVGSVSLSPRGDWRMPSDANYDAWMNTIE